MRYEMMGRARKQRLNVPQMLGGLNTATDAALIADDELADVCNLTFDHGALVTREAVRAVGDAPFWSESGEQVNVDFVKWVDIGGVSQAMVLSSERHTNTFGDEAVSEATVTLMTADGVRAYYKKLPARNNRSVAIAPCNADTVGAPFLAYVNDGVYIPDDTTHTMLAIHKDKLYVPLVMINGRSIPLCDYDPETYAAAGNGVMWEGYNRLTSRCRASFTPSAADKDAAGELYQLPSKPSNLPEMTMEIVSAKGTATVAIAESGEDVSFTLGETAYAVKLYRNGCLQVMPSLPLSDVANTVTVTYEREGAADLGRVSLATWFGGTQNKLGGTRLFLADCDKSRLLWSDVNNPLYIPENNYTVVGDPSQKITALEKQGEMLVIFKEREMFYTTYVQGEIDTDAVANGTNVDVTATQAYFPLTQLSPSIGCRSPKSIALCRDRLVWMDSDARVYTLVPSGQYSERNVREIGQKVRPYLLAHTTEAQRAEASAMDHKGKYRVMVGEGMAEFDYNESGFVNVSGYASGERAARNIAWMTHRFAFGEAKQTLVSDGADTALVISTAVWDGKVSRTAYAFDSVDADRYLTKDGIVEASISVLLTTKTYEFGDPAAYKRIDALFLMMRASDARLRTIVDGQAPRFGVRVHSDDLHAHLLVPCVKRCRTLALCLEATGHVCLKGLRLQYSLFGTVK